MKRKWAKVPCKGCGKNIRHRHKYLDATKPPYDMDVSEQELEELNPPVWCSKCKWMIKEKT